MPSPEEVQLAARIDAAIARIETAVHDARTGRETDHYVLLRERTTQALADLEQVIARIDGGVAG